jgi:hypothetical protein
MSGFINSVVRGAGFTIGRNIVGDFGKSQKTTSHRYYDRAENEMEKALNFPIKGRSETILGNCFHMYQKFDDETRTTGGVVFDILVGQNNKKRYYGECLEKIKDSKEYLELKNNKDENILKLDEINNKINKSFKTWINKLTNNILTINSSKDKDTVRYCWYGSDTRLSFKNLYTQCDNNQELITKIDNHLKESPIVNINKNSIWPVLIGLAFGLYTTYWLWNYFILK